MRAGREHQGLSQAAGQSAGRWLAEFAPPLALAPPRCSTRIGAASCLSPHWGGGARLRSLCRGLRAPRPPDLLVVWARAPRPREQGWPETATLWVSGGRTRGSGSGSGVLSPWWEGDGDRPGVRVTRQRGARTARSLVLRRLQVGDPGQFGHPLVSHAVQLVPWHRLPNPYPSSRLSGEL